MSPNLLSWVEFKKLPRNSSFPLPPRLTWHCHMKPVSDPDPAGCSWQPGRYRSPPHELGRGVPWAQWSFWSPCHLRDGETSPSWVGPSASDAKCQYWKSGRPIRSSPHHCSPPRGSCPPIAFPSSPNYVRICNRHTVSILHDLIYDLVSLWKTKFLNNGYAFLSNILGVSMYYIYCWD